MVLTEHQLLHLTAIIKDTKEILKLDDTSRKELTSNKKIKSEKSTEYLLKIIDDVNNIINSGKFPNIEKDYMIHDYIEKETKGEFK